MHIFVSALTKLLPSLIPLFLFHARKHPFASFLASPANQSRTLFSPPYTGELVTKVRVELHHFPCPMFIFFSTGTQTLSPFSLTLLFDRSLFFYFFEVRKNGAFFKLAYETKAGKMEGRRQNFHTLPTTTREEHLSPPFSHHARLRSFLRLWLEK